MSTADAIAASTADPAWAWQPFRPDARRPWNLRWAGHLYRRAAFGANWRQLQQSLADGPQRTVDRLVRPEDSPDHFDQSFDDYEMSAARAGGTEELRAWWLRRMIETPHPFREKMTLFWHSHFGISDARVRDARLMAQHVHMLRRHALGPYRALMEAVSKDPATFLGLNAEANRKAIPNDNLPRQLMERLALGRGGFREEDLREAARAFTGWFVLQGRLRYLDREHDGGAKTVLGQTGNWSGNDVLRIVLEQPAVPRLLARTLFRWFLSEVDEPSEPLLASLAERLSADLDVGRAAEMILRSNLFFSEAAYRRRVKGPVEFAVGIVRGLEGSVPTLRLAAELGQLGQDLYRPPTTSGWHGGAHWLNAATQLGRSNLAQALLAAQGEYGGRLDPAAVARQYGCASLDAAAKWVLDLFLQGDLPNTCRSALLEAAPAAEARDRAHELREVAWAAASLPEFQLC